ncbi:MAG: TonB-dependent siderophore receptor [Luteitalea sp.]|nr:TonB-dependent siderophore receptor [Luteitalea sp.]
MSIVCLLLTLVIPDLAPPQVPAPDTAAISGQVTDEASASLPGVVVTVDGTSSETTTDSDGQFRIDGLRPGRHVIRATLSGFAPAEQAIDLTAGETSSLALTLGEGAYVFERVVVVEDGYAVRRSVTSTRTSSELRRLPQSIQVINKDLTQDQGAVYLNDALKNASGVTMFSEYLDFNFRGFRAQDESVKVDGLNQVHDFFVKPRLLNVERVEVVKGPAGALYGQSKPGGFVNIITKQPSAQRSTTVTGHLGSWDKSEAQVSSTGPIPTIENLFYLVDAARIDNQGFRRHEQAVYTGLSGLVTWAPGPDTSITVGSDWLNDLARGHRNRGIPFYDHQLVNVPASFTVNEPDDRVEIDATTSRARFNHHVTDTWHMDASVSHLTNSSFQQYHEPMGLQPDGRLMRREFRDQYREKEQTALNANVAWTPTWSGVQHSLLAGTEYTLTNGLLRQGTASDSSLGGPVPDLDIYAPVYGSESAPLRFGYYGPDVAEGINDLLISTDNRVRAAGVYLQDHAQIGSRVNLLLGIRFDHFRDDTRSGPARSRTGQAVSLRGGGVVALTPQWSVYGSYAEGFEPPSASLSLDPERYGGPFDPETSWSAEGGVKGFLLGDRITTTLAVYHITKHDMLLRSPTPELPDRYAPVGAFESRGVELDVAGRVTQAFSVYANYSHSFRAEVTRDVDPANLGKAAENNPRDAANLWARYDLLADGRWRVGVAGGTTYVGRRLTFEQGDVLPSYTKADAALFVDVGRLGLALNVFNLTDERYFTGGYGGRIGGFLGAPRSYELRATYRF